MLWLHHQVFNNRPDCLATAVFSTKIHADKNMSDSDVCSVWCAQRVQFELCQYSIYCSVTTSLATSALVQSVPVLMPVFAWVKRVAGMTNGRFDCIRYLVHFYYPINLYFYVIIILFWAFILIFERVFFCDSGYSTCFCCISIKCIFVICHGMLIFALF